ncbi:hypothetical protein [Polynucleobacter arcticus]|uniref:Uncharacterized protein n=1 Tax=Polynucleobacter arcticus TaxID=1743165 RepID=A0A6M9PSM0_9BURK|nr:hypothetical protein [Polynucleobacter arcticus]QKM60926.1 hypothetical protein DN92_07760 [Polynucleobacter arcticus]
MRLSTLIISIGLFVTALSPAQAQQVNTTQVSPGYKESCVKEQMQVHAKLKGISAGTFNDFCDCTARQLSNSLSAAQLKELNQSKSRPEWFKTAEQAAGKVCLKEDPKTQV